MDFKDNKSNGLRASGRRKSGANIVNEMPTFRMMD